MDILTRLATIAESGHLLGSTTNDPERTHGGT